MPPSGGHAVVVRNIVPIVEVTGGVGGEVLVIADHRVCDRPESTVVGIQAVPVRELGGRTTLVHVSQVGEQVRIPRGDQVRDPAGVDGSVSAVPSGGKDERLAGLWSRSLRRGELPRVGCRFRDSVGECRRDRRRLRDERIAHIGLGLQRPDTIGPASGLERECEWRLVVRQDVFSAEREDDPVDAEARPLTVTLAATRRPPLGSLRLMAR